MQVTRIFETVIYADDLVAAERFYHDVLGLEVYSRSDTVVSLRLAGPVLPGQGLFSIPKTAYVYLLYPSRLYSLQQSQPRLGAQWAKFVTAHLICIEPRQLVAFQLRRVHVRGVICLCALGA